MTSTSFPWYPSRCKCTFPTLPLLRPSLIDRAYGRAKKCCTIEYTVYSVEFEIGVGIEKLLETALGFLLRILVMLVLIILLNPSLLDLCDRYDEDDFKCPLFFSFLLPPLALHFVVKLNCEKSMAQI